MAGDVTLPDLKDPNALIKRKSDTAPAQAAPRGVASASPFGGIMAQLDSMSDPWTKAIMQGAIEAKISERIGYRFHFPDPAEEDLQRQRTANDLYSEQIKGSQLAVTLMRAAVLDLPKEAQLSLGIQPGEDVFATDPDRAVAVSKALYDNNLVSAPITKGMLALSGLPTDTASVQAEQQQKDLASSASALDNAGKVAKAQSEAIEGKGLIGGLIAQERSSFESQSGTDVVDDADEPRGSEVFYQFADQTVRDVSKATGQKPALIAQSLLAGEYGANIKDQLEGLPTNGQGELMVGQGDKGVADEATFFLAAAVMNLASQAGVPTSEAMRQLGLPYTGIDLASLSDAGDAIAATKGVKNEAFFSALGPSFLDAANRMQAESQVRSKAVK